MSLWSTVYYHLYNTFYCVPAAWRASDGPHIYAKFRPQQPSMERFWTWYSYTCSREDPAQGLFLPPELFPLVPQLRATPGFRIRTPHVGSDHEGKMYWVYAEEPLPLIAPLPPPPPISQ